MAGSKGNTEKKLTAKQEMFCQEYLIDLNATQAAIRAGYSEATAKDIGCQNLAKLYVSERIFELQQERVSRTQVTQDQVIKELATIGFARIDDFVEVKEVEYEIEGVDEEGNPTKAKHTHKGVVVFNTSDVEKDKIPAISEIKQTRDGISLKLHDKVKTLELIGKHLGMFIDKVEHSGQMTIQQVTGMKVQ